MTKSAYEPNSTRHDSKCCLRWENFSHKIFTMTWLIEFSERNTWNFFQNFSFTLLFRNRLEMRRTRFKHGKTFLEKRFWELCDSSHDDSNDEFHRNTWNLLRSLETKLEVNKKKPWFKHSEMSKCASLCRVLYLNAQIAFLFHFQSRFWRTMWMKNSEKHYRYFSGWDLFFE